MSTFMAAREIKHCRVCNSKNLFEFLDLGSLPIPNGFLEKEDLKKEERRYPLVVVYCRNCSLTQLKYIVDPGVMFRNYLYIPSASQTRLNNFRILADDVNKRVKLSEKSLIVDVGSNDGSLLTVFKNLGQRVIGVDPAENLVTVAELNGVPTVLGYFNPETARKILRKEGKASAMFATNVFAHIGDIHVFLDGINILLDDDGVFISQFPYVLDLLRENQFDTIYHEHLSYFSVKSLLELAARSELEIFDIEHSPLDGGSLKVYWKKRGSKNNPIQNSAIEKFLKAEEKEGLFTDLPYIQFAKRVKQLKVDAKRTLKDLKQKGKSIVGYGAAAKGNILINYFGIGPLLFEYIVDSTPYKQGRFTPGTHIPIFAEAKILETKPDYVVILAWNFKEEIMKKNKEVEKYGGKFMVCIPKVMILS